MIVDQLIAEWEAFEVDPHRALPVTTLKYGQLINEIKRLKTELLECRVHSANCEIENKLLNLKP